MKIVVLDGFALNPGDLSWERFESVARVEVHPRTPPESILERAAGAEILLTNKTPLRAATLEQLPDLRYIGVLATGYDVIDIQAAKQRRVAVTNVPTYGTDSVAQMAFALLLELTQRVGAHHHSVREGGWTASPDWSYTLGPLTELAGKTMGIIGFGRIGRRVARIADAFAMRVMAHDAVASEPPGYPGFRFAPLEELLAESDAVSLHCPLTEATRGLINSRTLALMKPSAFLINTARGPLVDGPDLAGALNRNRLAGAGLDVLSIEPPPPANPLFTATNCILTPHIAWATREARGRLMDAAFDNVAAFLAGSPVNLVNP